LAKERLGLRIQRVGTQTQHVCRAAGDYTQDLVDAEQRWKNQLREGRVKSVNARTAGDLQKDGWTVLDVRPPTEVAKAGVEGAVEVPLYIPEDEVSPGAFLKNATAFGMGGWWIGGGHMKPNPNFMRDIVAKVPKDAKIVLGCQKGLRSLAAAEQLSKAGYGQLAWINGGFDAAAPTDLPVKGASDLRFGGIGGLSEILGWTDVQKQATKSEGFLGGGFTIIKFAIVIVILDGLLFAYEQASVMLNK
jgi:rhodanese-related sulfurtransferase